ncbi:MAG: phosphate/phosphite/phosphonate ABC transporter substrate-binding protein [Gammaproteobacteria bacterium]|nr:phosphate/phosphite/phosphonate ABC transporter substrate-binding protein [Gammaproteobacteria bacterium]
MKTLTLLLAFALCLPSAWARQVYTLSVVPQFTPVDIGLRWSPVLAYLEKEAGVSLQLRVMEHIPKFESDFLAGVPDFVFLNPYHAVMAMKAHGYVPLLRGGDLLNGILVVDRNSQIKRLADLNDKTLAFPSPNAFGASLYMRALLAEKENITFKTTYVGTHQNVYRHVLLGEAAAGGGVGATLAKESAAMRSRLTVLYSTPGVPSHPLAAHPRVPAEVRERLTAALLKLDHDPAGRKLLAAVELDRTQAADYARDYAPLEKLKLGQYAQIEKSGDK